MITIPTLKQIYDQIIADIESELSVNIPTSGPSFLRAFAAVQAAKIWTAYLTIADVQKNIFPDTADPVSMGGTLERSGLIKLGRLPFQATAGQYNIAVSGEAGAVIPASQTWKSDDTSLNPGILYILDEEYTMVSSSDIIAVRCLTAGSAGSLNDGDKLTPTSPIALVTDQAVVSSELITPLDAETIDEYRSKVLASYRLEPQGGAATDFRLWAQDAQGISQTYPYAKSGAPGEINLFVEATIADSTDGKGTPSASILLDVETVVNTNPDTTLNILERGRRPLNMVVNVEPITPFDVNITVVGFIGITAAIQSAILDKITSLVSSVRPFVPGIDILSDKNDVLDGNKIIAAILAVKPGAIFTSIVLNVDGDDVSTFTFEDGNIPFLDSITYS